MAQAASIDTTLSTQRLKEKTLVICIGAMKSGTTWLFQFFKANPNIYTSPIKELNFFNQLLANPSFDDGIDFRVRLMDRIILQHGWKYPPPRFQYERLKALAEIGAMGQDRAAYLRYFARRIENETAFCDLSPSYALLPPEGYRNMVDLGLDLRLVFLMRDPVSRTLSHIRHFWRTNTDQELDQMIENLKPGSRLYDRSDYLRTIEAVTEGAPAAPLLTLPYEDLFCEAAVKQICAFIGIAYSEPEFDKVVNAARGDEIPGYARVAIREKLDPIYRSMAVHFGADRPKTWLW